MEPEVNEMHRRRIHLRDGRYLIFYTFDDANDASGDTNRSEVAIASTAEGDARAEAKVRRRTDAV